MATSVQEADPGNDHDNESGCPGAPTTDSPLEGVETNSVDQEPGPPDSHPKTTPESTPTGSPDEAGTGKKVEESFEHPQTVFGIAEVRLGTSDE